MSDADGETHFIFPKTPVNFQCTKCGACCSNPNLFISVTIMDLVKWFRNGDEIKTILSTIGFYIYNEKDKEKLLNHMLTIPVETEKGPAFLGMLRRDNGECIMLDSNKQCKIYKLRPISCRQFPIGISQDENSKKIQIGVSPVAIMICEGLKRGKMIKKKEMMEQSNLSLISIKHDKEVIELWNSLAKNEDKKRNVSDFLTYVRDSHAFHLDILLNDLLGSDMDEDEELNGENKNLERKYAKKDKYSHITKKIEYRKKKKD